MAQTLSGQGVVSSAAQRTDLFRPLPTDPMQWLLTHFPLSFQNAQGQTIPMGEHHERFWRWLWALRPGQPSSTFIAIWARAGGKSSSIEMGAATVGYFGLRRYGLYVCATQPQADDHVANVATLLEQLGVERSLNKYGHSRGWRVNRVRTIDGFVLDAIGLDALRRGMLLDRMRPDFPICDDLDDQSDTELTTQKKIATLTQRILPSGSAAMAVVGVQNIPNANGIFAQLADGRAEFLLDREISGPFPALQDLPETDWWTSVPSTAGGPPQIRITAGRPTWVGQGIPECEALIAKIGIRAFLIECQHRVALLEGELFKRYWFRLVADWPREARKVRYWDFASTKVTADSLDPDWTVGLLVGFLRGQYWVIDMQRVRESPKHVEDLVHQTALIDGRAVEVWLEQEPGSSGVMVAEDYQRRVLAGFTVQAQRATGSKLTRAKPASSATQAGNMFVVQAPWTEAFLSEIVQLGLPGVHDDIADCLSGAVHALTASAPIRMW
jgi:predicted phage terminase large subunit-like protein